MVLETLGWGREPREEISFLVEGRLLYTQPTETNWRNLFTVKMAPVNSILGTLTFYVRTFSLLRNFSIDRFSIIYILFTRYQLNKQTRIFKMLQ